MTGSTDFNGEEAFLNEMEARVLGCLMEKQMATPEYYPLTLNALIAACNQKSSREPVMNLSQTEVGRIVQALRTRGLVTASMLGRTDRFEQQLSRKFGLKSHERALLCVLLLRGPQTLNELRTRTERMADFADIDAVHSTLKQMIERDDPLVIHLPRSPGQREDRYMHLLCGRVESVRPPSSGPAEAAVSSDLEARIRMLEEAVESLQDEIRALKGQYDR